jgi:HEAT repeat protein
MKHPSKRTWELIEKLRGHQSFWGNMIGWQELPLSAFDEIASLNEALTIPHLTGFLLNDRSDVRESAARTIGRLMANLSPADFIQLDEACRDYYTYQSTDWPNLKPREVKLLSRLPNGTSILGIASFHRSGFIREAAVSELASRFDGSELPFLLMRLNDWVEAVRKSAATAVSQRIREDYRAHFLRNLRLVFRLRLCGRSQHEEIISAVTALLQDPNAVPILRQGILSGDRWLRRESFQLAIVGKSAKSTELLKELLSDADPIIRLWAAKSVLERIDNAELMPIVSVLLVDRFMQVRCEALNIFARRFPNEALGKLEIALLDGHSSVRATARFWIKTQCADYDFAGVYRKSLQGSSAKPLRAAILGLGEVGNASDADVLLPFLDASSLSTRKAALRSLAALDGDRLVEHFVSALQSEHPGISNEALRALGSRTGTVLDQLHLLFRGETYPHVRKNLFRLLLRLPFWSRGIFLFEALRDRDEHIIELGRHAMQNWLSKSRSMATPPSKSDLQELGNGLRASAGMFPPRDVQEFEFLLRTYR